MAGYDEWVTMRHPETGGTSYVPREAYDELWAEKGWEVVSTATTEAASVVGHDVADLRHLSKDELANVASAKGVTVRDGASKSELVKALETSLENTKQEG